MKSTLIITTLLAVAFLSTSVLPASAAANTGTTMSSEDKAWCKKLKGYYDHHLADAGRAATRLQRTNSLEDAMFFLNAARTAGCPWSKTAQIPW